MPKLYKRCVAPTVEAMHWDGTEREAYEIIAWLEQRGTQARYAATATGGAHILHTRTRGEGRIHPDQVIVYDPSVDAWSIWEPENFRDMYTEHDPSGEVLEKVRDLLNIYPFPVASLHALVAQEG